MPIILNLIKCFGHGLKMCMWFGYNPQIILLLFPRVEHSYFQAFLLSKCMTPPTVLPFLLKLHKCFGHSLKICMWFGYNPQFIFCHYFCNLNLVTFQALGPFNINVFVQWVPGEGNFSYNSSFFQVRGSFKKFPDCFIYLNISCRILIKVIYEER